MIKQKISALTHCWTGEDQRRFEDLTAKLESLQWSVSIRRFRIWTAISSRQFKLAIASAKIYLPNGASIVQHRLAADNRAGRLWFSWWFANFSISLESFLQTALTALTALQPKIVWPEANLQSVLIVDQWAFNFISVSLRSDRVAGELAADLLPTYCQLTAELLPILNCPLSLQALFICSDVH